MNITFLVGNGFDMSIGLQTGYRSFYEYYLGHNHEDALFMNIKEDCPNYEKWSDLEIGLGKYLKNIKREDEIEEFAKNLIVLINDMIDYLHKEEEKIGSPTPELVEEFKNKILHFYSDFSFEEKYKYEKWISTVREHISYHFFTFNYTKCLREIIEKAQELSPFSTHHAVSKLGSFDKYNDDIKMVQDIHGTLNDGLILGINDISQIENELLRQEPRIISSLVKPYINEELGTGKIRHMKRTIDKSDYVCIYGMSIGKSDALWWEYIYQWLIDDEKHKLVIYVYEPRFEPRIASLRLEKEKYWRNFFLMRTMLAGRYKIC